MAKKDRAGDDSGRGRGRDDTQPDDRTTTAADTGRRGADDPAGDDRRGRGADDPPGDDRGGRGADDPPGDDRGGDAARLRGGDGSDSLSGSAADDRLRGDDGDDTLDGGAGADTLDGDDGADRLIGGQGADVFKVGDGGRALAGLDRIVDFTHGEDKLVFDDDGLTATEANFATGAAADYDAALAAANARMAAGADYVAVQVGADVIVFATELGEHHVESAVILVGRTLSDISAGDIG